MDKQQQLALLDEIRSDSARVGYSLNASADSLTPSKERSTARGVVLDDVFEKINQARGITVPRGPASKNEIWSIAKISAASLTSAETNKLGLLLAMEKVDMTDPDITELVDAALSPTKNSAQNAAIKALAFQQDGSRAELLIGRAITRMEVAEALWGRYR